jgi:hypothetical protein
MRVRREETVANSAATYKALKKIIKATTAMIVSIEKNMGLFVQIWRLQKGSKIDTLTGSSIMPSIKLYVGVSIKDRCSGSGGSEFDSVNAPPVARQYDGVF